MGTSVVDESSQHCIWLTENITSYVLDAYSYLAAGNHEKLRKILTKFLVFIEPRGILTMLGFRKTVGSQNSLWPSAH